MRRLAQAWRAMYYACRTDYPCEGCEQGRVRSAYNATAWTWSYCRVVRGKKPRLSDGEA